MTYRLSRNQVDKIVKALEAKTNHEDYTDYDKLLEEFESIKFVMEATDQTYVYIRGTDPNKL